MADIDFITDLSSGTFQITLGDCPGVVQGNRALLNRFEITFLTKTREFIWGTEYLIDDYGGNAQKFINQPQVLNNLQGIVGAVSTAIELTVQSILNDQPNNLSSTEKLASAQLISLDVNNGLVYAIIQVNPVEVEAYDSIKLHLPITRV